MGLTFLSTSQNKRLDLDSIGELTLSQLRELHAELSMAIMSMDDCMATATTEASAAGTDLDTDWLHKVRKKRRVCVAFQAQVQQRLDTANDPRFVFMGMYVTHLERLISDELGETISAELRDEARSLALEGQKAQVLGA
jgi:hypothetical protein